MTVGQANQPEIEPSQQSVKSGRSNREFLQGALKAPGVARRSFLLIEVLGPPVSLRNQPFIK